jgi:hypothetical protein
VPLYDPFWDLFGSNLNSLSLSFVFPPFLGALLY